MAQKEVSVQLTQTSASVEAATSIGASIEQSSSSATVTSAKVDQAQVIMVGPQGPPGPSGISGMQGISGLSGTGPVGPSGATGVSGISGMQGEQGSQGDQGDQGIQGPSGATGASGISGMQGIQGPSGATGISGISGMQGEQGIQGVQGDQGDQGDQGIQGPSGATGVTGAVGALGPIGPHITGVSGSGTGTSFFVSGGGILGPINIQGPSGATGVSGISGLKGDTGPQGDAGGTGPTGPQGSQGDQGLVGGDTFQFYFSTDTIDADPGNGYLKFGNSSPTSTTEIYVDDLEKGGDSISDWVNSLDDVYQSRVKVFSSSDAEKWAVFKVVSDNTAKVGYTQINVTYIGHSDLFVADEEVAMTFAPAAQGPKGDTGPTGPGGAQGDQGDQGAAGTSGIGITGISGSGTGVSFLLSGGGTLGPINIQGPSGLSGLSGISGMPGGLGSTGPQGAQGDKGDKGDQGDQGIQGIQGPSGATGATGAVGPIGPHITGVSGSGTGTSFFVSGGGVLGPINIQGTTGISGMPGGLGSTGPQGVQGIQGSQGIQGDQGIQGFVGGDTFNFNWSTDTSVADPGNGNIRFDTTTYPNVQKVIIDNLERGGDSVIDWISSFDHVTGSRFKIFDTSTAEKWAIFRIATDNTDLGGAKQLNVHYIAHSDSFTNLEEVSVSFAPAASGAPGHPGPVGATGVTGATGISITGVSGFGTGVYFLTDLPGNIGPLDIQATGATGATGHTGTTGQFGGDSMMFWFNSGYANSGYQDPGSGYLGFAQAPHNRALPSGIDYLKVSGIHVDDQQIDMIDISGWVQSFDDDADGDIKGRLRIYSATGSSQFVVYKITGSIVHHSGDPFQTGNNITGYNIIPVTGVSSGMAYTGYTGAFFSGEPVIMSYAQVGPQGPQGIQGPAGADSTVAGPTGATGATGAAGQGTGDFGGDSFSFYYNSGYTAAHWADGPGDSGFKLFASAIPPDTTGIDVSYFNHRGGAVSGWLLDFGSYGDETNRGILKIFTRDKVNENWMSFTITGNPTVRYNMPKTSAPWVNIGASWRTSSEENFPFTHSGETVISFVPAGPTGQVGSIGATGVTGATGAGITGATGATGDFGGYSFSFYFNSGYSEALWSEGPGTSGLKLVTPNDDMRDTSGIDISHTNYRGGDASQWLDDFGNYGDVANRGILKLFHRDKVNVNWAAFLITGEPAYHGYHHSVGVTWKSSSSNTVRDVDGGVFTHSGETVVSFVPAGPSGGSGAAGEGGGGGAGAPATGYTGAFQFHGGDIVLSLEGDRLGPGSLSGSNALWQGLAYEAVCGCFTRSNSIGVGEFFGMEVGSTQAWELLTGMSGTLDVRGDIYSSGSLIPHQSGAYSLGDKGEEGFEPGNFENGKWWFEVLADYGYINNLETRGIHVTGALGHPPAKISVGTYDPMTFEGGNGIITSPTGYYDTLGSWSDYMGSPAVDTSFHGIFLHENCMHFSPQWDGGADLGTPDLYWNSLYLNNNSLVMSGVGMSGAVHIGFDNDHNLRISAPKTGNEVTLSGTPVTGYSPNTLADLRLSGDSASEATTLRATSEGEISISTESEEGGQTTLSNAKVTSPVLQTTLFSGQSGTLVSGLSITDDAGETIFDVHDAGSSVGDLTFCGQVNQCVEDLGEFKSTGWAPDPYAIGAGGSSFNINMAGSNLKKFNLSYHAHGLNLVNIEAGRSITIQVTAVDAYSVGENYFRFLSGNNFSFIGIEPHTLEIGKVGMLTITAYGSTTGSCVCHWAESDYTL